MFALCIESSHQKGMGHLFRGITLAHALQQRQHEVVFVVNHHAPSLTVLNEKGHRFHVIEDLEATGWEDAIIAQENVTVWVNDRLATSTAHTQVIKHHGIPLIHFDDPGSGAKDADIHFVALNALQGQKPQGRVIKQGLEYLILNPQIPQYQRERREFRSILVTLGGSDTYGLTPRVAKALQGVSVPITIVIGPSFEHQDTLKATLTEHMTLKHSVPSMIEEMSHHDLAITGGGVTPFEANASGLPCLIIANERFEIPNGQLLETLGSSLFIGHHEEMSKPLLPRELPIAKMSLMGIEKVPTDGCEAVVNVIEGYA